MKTILLLLLASMCLSRAATINLNGRMQGRLNADYQSGNQYTQDFYFINISEPTMLIFNWCATSGPGGAFGNTADLAIYHYSDSTILLDGQNLMTLRGILGAANDCDLDTISLNTGTYVLNITNGSGGFDGKGALRPIDEATSEFEFFDYQGTMQGGATLTAIWRGQANNTFQITNIPEPSTVTALALSAFLLTPRAYVKPSSAA
jgi:hypothetical protein